MASEKDEVFEMLRDILTERQRKKATLIRSLHEIQKENGYLPQGALMAISEGLDVPLSEVYSTASFYKQFYFTPRGKNLICICVGTACHVRGAKEVVSQLEGAFGIKVGETAQGPSVTLETVGCVGCCGIAPVMVVNGKVIGGLTLQKTNRIIERILRGVYEKA